MCRRDLGGQRSVSAGGVVQAEGVAADRSGDQARWDRAAAVAAGVSVC